MRPSGCRPAVSCCEAGLRVPSGGAFGTDVADAIVAAAKGGRAEVVVVIGVHAIGCLGRTPPNDERLPPPVPPERRE